MQVAVYSGSFDPLHIGHLAILRYLSGRFDMVRLVVSPHNPLKDASKADSATRRLEGAKAALERHPELGNVIVDDIEFGMPLPNYSIRTLDVLRDRYPEEAHVLTIGADNLAVIRQWRDYSRVLLEYGVIVYPREGVDLDGIRDNLLGENPNYRIELVDAELVNISSTRIREALGNGGDVSDLLM